MKACIKCGVIRPLTDFYKHPTMADGHLNKCKPCARSDALKNRQDNIEVIREYDRQRGSLPSRIAARSAYQQTEQGRAAANRARKSYADRHPKRRAAHVALGNAVRDGSVSPWPVCALPECDATKVEAHHADYNSPLGVVWLCAVHHRQAHALFKQLLSGENT